MTDRFDDGPTDPHRVLDPDQFQELHRERTGDDLVAAVYANPDDDEPRLVYGDYLIEREDPRGELIQLQLSRARTNTPSSERERELLAVHLETWTAPLYPALVPGSPWFERGFLAGCATRDSTIWLRDVIGHPMWLTVEHLTSGDIELLTNPCMRSLRRLSTTPVALAALTCVAHAVRVTHVSMRNFGVVTSYYPDRERSIWQQIWDVGALQQVCSLTLMVTADPNGAEMSALLTSKLGQQLAELEVVLPRSGLSEWARVLREHPTLRRLVFRPGEAYAPTPAPTPVVTLERDDRGEIHIVVAFDDEVSLGGVIAPLRMLPKSFHTIEAVALDPNRPLSAHAFEELASSVAPRHVIRR